MFSSSPNYTKLKTNLRLALNRLKLLEKKKTELTMKARREIADYIQAGKYERAKIRVEHIIREDYLVEAMEIVEMYCDLLLARFGLITQMKELDDGIAEAVSSLIWVSPRMFADVQELKLIAEIFTSKYGHQYGESCRTEDVKTISEKLKHKLSVQSPPKLLVEKYLIEIAKNYNIPYEPDPQVMQEEANGILIDLSDRNNLGDPQPAGFIGYPTYPTPPSLPAAPFNYPNLPPQDPSPGFSVGGHPHDPKGGIPFGAPFSYNIPPAPESKESNISYHQDDSLPTYSMATSQDYNFENTDHDAAKNLQPKISGDSFPNLPDLPSVPSDTPQAPTHSSDIDFDDLTRRFEELKKKK
ncbi:IST1 homolog isoform X1 [Photinus pyralis]|uniref:IST1 homolog n=1 Tax=Photinus pyralis TaxID=7054 RepID=A0A1Y1M5T1_PHOPY|nr:IST1 homolog isoform X1 [Photinus pyralis]